MPGLRLRAGSRKSPNHDIQAEISTSSIPWHITGVLRNHPGPNAIAGETTKTHVKRILAKLGLRDRAQAAVVAYESGLVTPGG
jgi:hypothetical protein